VAARAVQPDRSRAKPPFFHPSQEKSSHHFRDLELTKRLPSSLVGAMACGCVAETTPVYTRPHNRRSARFNRRFHPHVWAEPLEVGSEAYRLLGAVPETNIARRHPQHLRQRHPRPRVGPAPSSASVVPPNVVCSSSHRAQEQDLRPCELDHTRPPLEGCKARRDRGCGDVSVTSEGGVTRRRDGQRWT